MNVHAFPAHAVIPNLRPDRGVEPAPAAPSSPSAEALAPERPADRLTLDAVEESADVRADRGGERESRPRGVIRNLLAGHFRGVADVRLRMNFADELPADAAAVHAEVAAGVGSLAADTTAWLDAALEGLDEETATSVASLREGFAGSVDEALSSSADGSGDLLGAVRAAAGGLLEGLAALVPADAGTDAAASGLEALRAELAASFEETLARLEETLAADVLPPLSEPNGNGRAYERFLAAYRGTDASASTFGAFA